MGRPTQARFHTAHWKRLRRAALDRDGWRCVRCGIAGPLEVHHVIPLEEGGTDVLANVASLCRACHMEAHNRKPGPDRKPWRAELARRLAG